MSDTVFLGMLLVVYGLLNMGIAALAGADLDRYGPAARQSDETGLNFLRRLAMFYIVFFGLGWVFIPSLFRRVKDWLVTPKEEFWEESDSA